MWCGSAVANHVALIFSDLVVMVFCAPRVALYG
jgi:hypothetical protein